jgi:hypothetical protein
LYNIAIIRPQKVDFLEIWFNFIKENLMHNILFNISATALQKQLEKEAHPQLGADFDVSILVEEETQPNIPVLRLLINRLMGIKAARSHVISPRLKNKLV